MNCLLQDVPDSTDQRGWRRVRCQRPGCKFHATPRPPSPHPHDKIYSPCTGWPEWWRIGDWLELELKMLGIVVSPLAWLRWKLGLIEVPECNCEARKAWLNTLGGKLSQRTDRLSRLAWRWLGRRLPPPAAKG